MQAAKGEMRTCTDDEDVRRLLLVRHHASEQRCLEGQVRTTDAKDAWQGEDDSTTE